VDDAARGVCSRDANGQCQQETINMNENKNQLTEDDCQRVANGEEQPQSYNKNECEGCQYWDCLFQPPDAMEKFHKDERDALFPNGEDDGNALDKEGL
jgi:hypothetical protein